MRYHLSFTGLANALAHVTAGRTLQGGLNHGVYSLSTPRQTRTHVCKYSFEPFRRDTSSFISEVEGFLAWDCNPWQLSTYGGCITGQLSMFTRGFTNASQPRKEGAPAKASPPPLTLCAIYEQRKDHSKQIKRCSLGSDNLRLFTHRKHSHWGCLSWSHLGQ
jgi:hypothetical protein